MIAFDTAFNAVALLFVFAAPVLVTVKIGLHRYAKIRALQLPQAREPQVTDIAISVEQPDRTAA